MERCIQCHSDSCGYLKNCPCSCHKRTMGIFPIKKQGSHFAIGEPKPLDPNFRPTGGENKMDTEFKFLIDNKDFQFRDTNNILPYEATIKIFLTKEQFDFLKDNKFFEVTVSLTKEQKLRNAKLEIIKEFLKEDNSYDIKSSPDRFLNALEKVELEFSKK